MTVKGLLDQLNKMPPDLEVWLSIDEEGNAFREVFEADVSPGVAEDDDWRPVAAEDIGEHYHEDDIVHKVVIWP